MKNNESNLIIKPKSTQIHHDRPTPLTQPNRPNSSKLKENPNSTTQRSSNPAPSDLLQIKTIEFFMFFPNYYNQTQISKPPPPRQSYNSHGSLPHQMATPPTPPLI